MVNSPLSPGIVAGLVGALCGGLFGLWAAAFVERWPHGHIPRSAWARRPSLRRARGGERLSRPRWRLAVVAVACPIVGALCVGLTGVGWRALSVSGLALVLVPVVAIDLAHRLIPDLLIGVGAGPAVFGAVAADPGRWWIPLVGAVGGGGFLLLLWAISPAGMGLGDVKLTALIGLVTGAHVVGVLVIAFLGGTAVGVLLFALKGRRARTIGLPFAPLLALGAAAMTGAQLSTGIGWDLGLL